MKYSEGAGSFLSLGELRDVGFSSVGENVLVSRKASIYNPEKIDLGDSVRVDDFCCLSGRIQIGRNTHVTPFCLIAGGEKGIRIGSFCTFAYRVSIFSQSDDYFGSSMVNSTIPSEFKSEIKAGIYIDDHVIIGAGTIVLPGVNLAEGTSIGASSLVTKSTSPWGIYYGIPAKLKKSRSQDLLKLVPEYNMKYKADLGSSDL